MTQTDTDHTPGGGDQGAAHDDKSLEGARPPMDTPEQRATAIEWAFDYRGDVTLELRDGRSVEGYVYDRLRRADMPEGMAEADRKLRVLFHDGTRMTYRYGEVVSIGFTGRDTAAGKSWETWIKKYAMTKLAGEKAELVSETDPDR